MIKIYWQNLTRLLVFRKIGEVRKRGRVERERERGREGEGENEFGNGWRVVITLLRLVVTKVAESYIQSAG